MTDPRPAFDLLAQRLAAEFAIRGLVLTGFAYATPFPDDEVPGGGIVVTFADATTNPSTETADAIFAGMAAASEADDARAAQADELRADLDRKLKGGESLL